MRKKSVAAPPQVADPLTPLVNGVLDRTERCVRIWRSNNIEVVGTDHREVSDVRAAIDCLLRPVPRPEAEARLRSLIACEVKRPKLVEKLTLVAIALSGEHPRARLRSKRHKHELKGFTDEFRGGLLRSVFEIFEAASRKARKPAPFGTSRAVVQPPTRAKTLGS